MSRLFRFDALFLYAVAYLLFLYAPVLLLPLFSFNDSIYIAFPLKGFTFEWYRQMAENGPLIQALQNSLKLAVTVSIICTALGLLAAKGLMRPHLPGKRLITGLLLLPLVVPVLILGIGLLVIARQIFEIPLSLFTVGAGHVLLCLPFATLVLTSRLEGFDRSLEEASLDLGESAWRTFWRVTVPLALPGIVASLLLCFTISFDEFVLAFFLAGNEATLPMFIFSQLRFPNKLPGVLALGSLILLFSFVAVALSEWLRRQDVPAK